MPYLVALCATNHNSLRRHGRGKPCRSGECGMRTVLCFLAALLLITGLKSSASAQATIPYRRPVESSFSSYARVSFSAATRQSTSTLRGPSTAIGIQTTVNVPDGGEALAGGYSSARNGRTEFGTPVLGKTPMLGRGLNNTGYTQNIHATRASVRVRIIRM